VDFEGTGPSLSSSSSSAGTVVPAGRALWTEILRRRKRQSILNDQKVLKKKQTNGWPFFDLTNHSDGGGSLSFHWGGFYTKTFIKDDIGNFMKEAQVQVEIHRSKLAPSASGLDWAKWKYHGLNTFSIRFNKSSSCCRMVHKSLENQWCSSLPHTESSKLSTGAYLTVALLLL
jgi:hypothetical protein